VRATRSPSHGHAFDTEVEDDAARRIGAEGPWRAAICWLTSEEREFNVGLSYDLDET
jgi:hypothetical protein